MNIARGHPRPIHQSITMLRTALGALMGLTVLASTLGPPTAAQVEAAGEPAAHVQVILRNVYIYNDRDPGKGEFEMVITLSCVGVTAACPGGSNRIIDVRERNMSGNDGDTILLGDVLPDGNAPVAKGYALSAGLSYPLRFDMRESDDYTADEFMGSREIVLRQENGWSLGVHKLRSIRGDNSWGDYEIEFEVRRVLMPDLRPVNIKITDLPNSAKKHVCMAVQNIEPRDAGRFDVTLSVNGNVPPGGQATANGLAPGTAGEFCVDVDLPVSGQHKLAATADLFNTVDEYNETNNVYEQTYTATAAPVTTAPKDGPQSGDPQDSQQKDAPQDEQSSGDVKPDLTVAAIRVNDPKLERKDDGQKSEGKNETQKSASKNECKDGKYTVSVLVKNGGQGKADGFAVRLTVNGDEAGTESVNGLDAGQERELTFDGVKLKKGEGKLSATVDHKKAVAETDEANNQFEMTARCGETM